MFQTIVMFSLILLFSGCANMNTQQRTLYLHNGKEVHNDDGFRCVRADPQIKYDSSANIQRYFKNSIGSIRMGANTKKAKEYSKKGFWIGFAAGVGALTYFLWPIEMPADKNGTQEEGGGGKAILIVPIIIGGMIAFIGLTSIAGMVVGNGIGFAVDSEPRVLTAEEFFARNHCDIMVPPKKTGISTLF